MSLKLYFLLAVCLLSPAVLGKDFPTLNILRSKTPPAEQTSAVESLIQRFVGERSKEFKVKVNPDTSSYLDNFQVLSDGKVITIQGTTGVAAARGFYHVLTELFGGHISWSGNRIPLPEPGHFPVIKPGEINVTSPQRFRYYQNVCTASYSFVWWNWTRWEQEIDWMALNGYNLPLAFNGQEGIWQKVYLKMGLTQADLDKHFGGPAFLAWERMGNIRGWGGPLPQSWLSNDLALQKQIIKRMRSFGIIPVLPGFAGHVPSGFSRVFPQAQVSQLSPWGHFDCNLTCTYFLDPMDPLFKTVGKAFIETQAEEYGGTDHIYNADTFNEMTPKSSDPNYLSNVSHGVFEGITAGDPDGIWLMQGWLFLNAFWGQSQMKALLQGVPEGRMIVLDLAAESTPIYSRSSSFYGQPFIWCMLHNFGGNTGMYGKVLDVNEGPFTAMKFKDSTMIGMGITPEGIEQNDVVYNFFNSLTFRDTSLNVTQWFSNYYRNRYGVSNANIDSAWQSLCNTVYSCRDSHSDHDHGVPVRRPSLTLSPDLWYNWRTVGKAWKMILSAADLCGKSDLCRYDLVDVTRQVLEDLSFECYKNLTTAFENKNLDEVKVYGGRLEEIIQDMDNITSSHSKWLLGHWLEASKRKGTNEDEMKLYEYNARNQITLWGPDGNILDYGNKQWGGLLRSYYYSRWVLFTGYLQDLVMNQTKYDQQVFNKMSFQVESSWTFARDQYPTNPTGDTVAISSSLYSKYQQFIEWPAYSRHPFVPRELVRRDSAYSYQQGRDDVE
ncbi:Alpha-N-acetylglucosaminidase [Holothuria leucospilota]|uniref:Alpha-N-acetylglucosaminidase n=1 Tax=Holothuria leucospilota TaxID=206669 RepID=A0A9Q1HCP1_HOLLE|nr:Alpha-N-acetylglucosaminidase [Holothuria leucospilota]